MERSYNMYSQGSSGWTSMRNEEFQEGDVWNVFKERTELGLRIGKSSEPSPNFTSRHEATAARMVPRANRHPTEDTKLVQHSAPVNIPDWSKIYGANSEKTYKNASWVNDNSDDEGDGSGGLIRGSWDSDEDEEEDNDGIIPPHEWLAKKLATNQISSFSVCEGVGRTLKGRDLRMVRNAVLTKTGFLE